MSSSSSPLLITRSNSVKIFKLSIKDRDDINNKIYYVKTSWKVDSLRNLSGLDGKIVCELIVTNCYTFWTRDVTLSDLKRTKPNNIRVEKTFCEATYAALSGFESYENQALSCKVVVNNDNNAEFSWNWFMNDETTSMKLAFTLGNLKLYSISQMETIKMWQEWLDFFIGERNHFLVSRVNYETRIGDLSEITDQMKGKVETMTSDKNNNQKNLTEKFKTVINTKKRKAKKILSAIEGAAVPSSTKSPKVSEDEEDKDDEPSDKPDELDEQKSSREESKSPKSKRTKKIKVGSNKDELPEEKEEKEGKEKKKRKERKGKKDQKEKEEEVKEEEQEKQEEESVLTRTFRGQIIKSRRLTRRSAASLDDILDDTTPKRDDNTSQDPPRRRSGRKSGESADDLLSKMKK